MVVVGGLGRGGLGRAHAELLYVRSRSVTRYELPIRLGCQAMLDARRSTTTRCGSDWSRRPRRLLADEGPDAVTTRRVAAEVGTSTTAIYSLIGSKDELVRADVPRGLPAPGRPPGRGRPHRRSARRPAPPRRGVPRDGGREPPPLPRDVRGVVAELRVRRRRSSCSRWGTLQVLVDAVARCVDAGLLEGDPTDLALELWSYNHGLTSLGLTGMLGRPPTSAPGQRLAGVAGRPRPRRGRALSHRFDRATSTVAPPRRRGTERRTTVQASPLWCRWA